MKNSIIKIIGNDKNDYVNRYNEILQINGSYLTKYFQWGNLWRTYDDSTDTDN